MTRTPEEVVVRYIATLRKRKLRNELKAAIKEERSYLVPDIKDRLINELKVIQSIDSKCKVPFGEPYVIFPF